MFGAVRADQFDERMGGWVTCETKRTRQGGFTCCQIVQLGREELSLSELTDSCSSDVLRRGDRLGPEG